MKDKIILGLVVFLALVLRLFRLGDVPPSLYWDEASLGYNAYAIATTLHDEHGEFLPLTRFIAFGDYKPPGYIYATAGVIKLLGLSEWTIRLPSALAGTLLVLVTYGVVLELFAKKRLAQVSALLVAISPWAFHFSHAAFEANLATLFSALGIYFFLRAVRTKSALSLTICALSFAAAMYTFNSHKVFIPLILFALILIYRPWSKRALVAAVLFVLLLLPLARYSLTREAQLRFTEVAWINDLAPIELANSRVALDGGAWWAKILHNRRLVFAQEFLKHYTDNFKASFLFASGDENQRLSIQSFGEMYWLDIPFLLAGLWLLAKGWRQKSFQVLLAWVILAPIPAAFARETPHALRLLNVLPIPQVILALGIVQFWRWRWFIFSGYLLFAGFYFYNYFQIYPVKYASAWQYGYKQVVQEVAAIEKNYPCVIVTPALGRPYIYFLLYNQYDPKKYWESRQADRDWYGFWTVHSFDKYRFTKTDSLKDACLQVDEPQDVPTGAKVIKTVNDLEGHPVFVIHE